MYLFVPARSISFLFIHSSILSRSQSTARLHQHPSYHEPLRRRGQVVLAVRLQPCHVRTDRPFRLNEPQVFRLDRPTMGTEVFVGVIACPVLYTLEHFFTDTSTAPDGNVKLRCTSKKTIFFSRSACHRTYRARVKKALVVYVYGCHAIVSPNHSR
jgi:hypothetical protein